MFRSFLHVKNEEEYLEKLEEMKKSQVWNKNKKVRLYFTNTWLSVADKWLPCLLDRNYMNNTTTNSGIEVQNRIVKKSFRAQSSYKTLTKLITVLEYNVFPELFKNSGH